MRGAIHVRGCPEVDAALRATTRAPALKRLISCSLAAAALLGASDWARAADMPLEVPPVEPGFGWTGSYVGLHIGGASSAGNYATPDAMCQFGGFFCPGGASGHNQPFYQGAGSTPAQYDLASSLVGGVTSGFNRQIGKAVLGLEGEAAYVSMSGSGQFLTNGHHLCNPVMPLNPPCSNYGAFSTLGNWYGTITARLGMTRDALFPTWAGADRALLYLKGGPALGRFGTGVSSSDYPGASFALINFSNVQTVWGVAAGGGLEWAMSANWSVKVEYEYLAFAHTTQACGLLTTNTGVVEVPSSNFCMATAMHGVNTAKVGINYRFSDRLWPF